MAVNFLEGLLTGQSGGLGGGNRFGDFFLDLLFGQDDLVNNSGQGFGDTPEQQGNAFRDEFGFDQGLLGSRGSPGFNIGEIVKGGGRRGRGVTNEVSDLFANLGGEFDTFFEGARGRVDRELPLNPFTDEERERQQQTIFDLINSQSNSLARQAGTGLNVRGGRGAGLQTLGTLNAGRFGAEAQAANDLFAGQRDFNQRAAGQRAGFLQNLDQLQSGLKLASTSEQGRALLEQLGIISGETEGFLSGVNTNRLDELFDRLLSQENKDADSNLIRTIIQSLLPGADNIGALSFLL